MSLDDLTETGLSGLGPTDAAVTRRPGRAWVLPGRLGRTLGAVTVSTGVVLLGWLALVQLLDLDPLVARSPTDVWRYLATGPEAGPARDAVLAGLRVTLRDAGLGFVAGLAAAAVVAVSFSLSRTAERSFMPVAMMLRSVPLVAMTPVLTLVFGRGTAATTVITGIVVFFPALVNLVLGLRSTSGAVLDVCRAYGAGPLRTLVTVSVPSALPAFFASARISVPGAIIGALLAEWLATGKGLGYRMLQDGSTFEYDDLWASAAAVCVASVAIYAAVGVVESLVLARFGPAPSR